MSRILRHSLLTFVAEGAVVLLSIVGGLLTVRLLGAAAYGQLALAAGTAALAATLGQLGLSNGLLHLWGAGRRDVAAWTGTLGVLALVAGGSAAAVAAAWVVLAPSALFEGVSRAALGAALAGVPLLVATLWFAGLLQVRGDVGAIAAARVGGKVAVVAALALLFVASAPSRAGARPVSSLDEAGGGEDGLRTLLRREAPVSEGPRVGPAAPLWVANAGFALTCGAMLWALRPRAVAAGSATGATAADPALRAAAPSAGSAHLAPPAPPDATFPGGLELTTTAEPSAAPLARTSAPAPAAASPARSAAPAVAAARWRVDPPLARDAVRASLAALPGMLALFALARLDFFLLRALAPLADPAGYGAAAVAPSGGALVAGGAPSLALADAALGLYAAAYAVAELLLLVGYAVSMAFAARIASAPMAEAAVAARRAARWIGGLGMAAAAVVALAAPLLLELYGGRRFFDGAAAGGSGLDAVSAREAAATALRWLAPGVALHYVYIQRHQLLVRAGRWGAINALLLGAAGLNAALNVALIPAFGLAGAAAATTASMAVLVAAAYWPRAFAGGAGPLASSTASPTEVP